MNATKSVLVAALTLLSTLCLADPPRPRPDYLASLRANEWAFAYLLWQRPLQPCKSDGCEAGFFSPPLVLSVQVEPSVEEDGSRKYAILIVAGVQNCNSIMNDIVRAREFRSLSEQERGLLLGERVRRASRLIAESCKVPPVDVATESLRRLVTPPSVAATD